MKRVKLFFFLLPALYFFFSSPEVVLAETKTFNASQDAFANQAYPTNNYGSLEPLIISNKFTTRLSFVQFEELILPAGAIIDKALFKFYIYEHLYADHAKVNLGPITSTWSENNLTWENKPTINQTLAIEAEIDLTSNGWKEINLTNLAKKWADGTLEQKGLFLYPLGYLYGASETEYAFTFKSKQAADSTPKLEIEYHFEASPVPSLSPSPKTEVEATEEPEATITASEESVVSPSPSSEAGESGRLLGLFSPGQAIIGGLIILALIGALVSFLVYALKPKKKTIKEKEEKLEEKTSE
ncbi:MAG: DNRLRE domain-containing protein [Candidatus Marinimicrobia bacterium]|nr:DNRLRE domain-containing protein [Candidatus Neomarinimicrobiota bacterium]